MKQNSLFPKNPPIFVHWTIPLVSEVISYCRPQVIVFPILQETECNLIQKFGTLLQNITHCAFFRRNNSIFMQNDNELKKKYQLWKEFIFQQLRKLQNLPLLSNITAHSSTKKKKERKRKCLHFKVISFEKS